MSTGAIRCLALLGMLLGLVLPGQAQSGWKDLESKEGRFRAFVPAAIKEEIVPVETQLGTLQQHQFFYGTDKGAYLVVWADYPAEKVTPKIADQIVAGVRDTAIKGARLTSERKIVLDGHPGLDLTFQKPDNKDGTLMITVRSQIFLVGNRLYQIQVATSEVASRNSDTLRFLNSFHISK